MKKTIYNKGKKHPAYKNGSGRGHIANFSRQAIIILGGVCENCYTTNNIEAHHIDSNPRNNTLSNIKVLCRRCHRAGHRKWPNRKVATEYYREIYR